ncbi:MAG: hypothetical protein ACPIOQ_58925, partial [Promethearchaeia archaeon]
PTIPSLLHFSAELWASCTAVCRPLFGVEEVSMLSHNNVAQLGVSSPVYSAATTPHHAISS